MLHRSVSPGGRPVVERWHALNHGLQQIQFDGASRAVPFLHGARDIPFHWHPEMEVLWVLKGTVQIVVEGRSCIMQEEDLMIINSDETHNSVSLSNDTVICGAHFDTAYFEKLGLQGFAERYYRCKSFLHGKPFQTTILPMKAFLARMILGDMRRSDDPFVRAAMAMGASCYIHRLMSWSPVEHRRQAMQRNGRDRIRRIVNRLACSSPAPALGEMAEAEGVTISHLSRLFRAHTGIRFQDYVQNIRIDAIAEDLLTTSNSIQDIMLEHGVGNPSVFYHRFRDRFGYSPGQLRQRGPALEATSHLSDESREVAMGKLRKYLPCLAMASEITFGLTATGKKHAMLTALHQPPFPRT